MRNDRPTSSVRRLVLLAAAAAVLIGSAAGARAYTREGDTESESEEISKKIQVIDERLSALQQQEFALMGKIMEMQQKANSLVDDPSKVPGRLAKGDRSGDLMKFKAFIVASAQQVQRFDAQFLPLIKQVQQLQQKTQDAPEPIKVQVEGVASRVMGKHRTNLEKIANLYEQAGEWRPALAHYLQVYAMIPESERLKENELTESIADMYHRLGDYKHSLALYKALFEAKPEKQRYSDTKFAEKVADAFLQGGDPKTALEMYRQVHDKISDKDEKGKRERARILKKIEQVKENVRE
ncbi:MAG: hypothetical protein ISS74_00795 [Planctomycetes bacterium]|nr:hypothetical protein [Planctomycetota bacterium]